MKNIKNMKYLSIIFALSISLNAIAQDAGSGGPILKNASDSLDYFFGVNLGYSMDGNQYITDNSLMLIGFMTALEKRASLNAQAAQDLFRALVASKPTAEAPNKEDPSKTWRKDVPFWPRMASARE